MRRLEAEYIANSGDGAREAWLAAQDAVNSLEASKADKLFFFNKLAFYEEGGQMGEVAGENSAVTTAFSFYWGFT